MLGVFATMFVMGLALATDALSLGIGLGAQGMRWRDGVFFTGIVGLMNIAFPLTGMTLGVYLHDLLGHVFQQMAAIVLLLLGAKMMIAAMQDNSSEPAPGTAAVTANRAAVIAQLTGLAFGVSIDALSVGVSLSAMRVPPFSAALLFGLQSGALALFGLYLGRTVNSRFGEYGQLLGGLILLALGCKMFA
jgi:putative Mn2+ efflux pump MntP